MLAVSGSCGAAVEGLADLARPEVKRIAIANPEFAPYGLAAHQALEKADLWERLTPRIVPPRRSARLFSSSSPAMPRLVWSPTRSPVPPMCA